jgi:hypothetical protein
MGREILFDLSHRNDIEISVERDCLSPTGLEGHNPMVRIRIPSHLGHLGHYAGRHTHGGDREIAVEIEQGQDMRVLTNVEKPTVLNGVACGLKGLRFGILNARRTAT